LSAPVEQQNRAIAPVSKFVPTLHQSPPSIESPIESIIHQTSDPNLTNNITTDPRDKTTDPTVNKFLLFYILISLKILRLFSRTYQMISITLLIHHYPQKNFLNVNHLIHHQIPMMIHQIQHLLKTKILMSIRFVYIHISLTLFVFVLFN